MTDSDWKKAVDFLTFRKRQVMLIQVLSPDEIEPLYAGRMHFLDTEAEDMADPKNMKLRITRGLQQAYAEALKDFRKDLKSFCVSRGADYLSVSSAGDLEKMLFGELLQIGMIS
jgi:uncharacterized protein (DUF58 family)